MPNTSTSTSTTSLIEGGPTTSRLMLCLLSLLCCFLTLLGVFSLSYAGPGRALRKHRCGAMLYARRGHRVIHADADAMSGYAHRASHGSYTTYRADHGLIPSSANLEVTAMVARHFGEPEPDDLGFDSWLKQEFPVCTSDSSVTWSAACQEAMALKLKRMERSQHRRKGYPRASSMWDADGYRAGQP